MWCIRLLAVWYNVQQFTVKWGYKSNFYNVTIGIRQGGILSPSSFARNLHNIDAKLSESGVGCHTAVIEVNHLLCADDLCCMCPSAKSWKTLLQLCSDYPTAHDLVLTVEKSVCMVVFSIRPCKEFYYKNF